MADLVAELSERARGLSAEDRARLAEELLASVQQDASDPQVEDAWKAEIRRRLDEVENGTAKLVPADEVFAEIRRLMQ